MHNRHSLCLAICTACLAQLVAVLVIHAQEPPSSRILKSTEAEQTAWLKSYLDHGMQPSDVLSMLVLNKSSLALPLIEEKIEEVLHSPSPRECFSDQSVDPQAFVGLAASMIAYAGDAQALREIGKLVKIDPNLFGRLVEDTLGHAESFRNPFAVAYQGLELSDPLLTQHIGAWVEAQLASRSPIALGRVKDMWAEAMVVRYSGVPTESQWMTDPIVTKLKTPTAGTIHNDMIRKSAEAVERGLKKR
jgi:hypothetical protein